MLAMFNNTSITHLEAPVYAPNLDHFEIPFYLEEESALISELGGGYFEPEWNEFVPNRPSLISRIYRCAKESVNVQINTLFSSKTLGLNNAQDPQTLRKDARKADGQFREMLGIVAAQNGGETYFGPGGLFSVKKMGSLRRKILLDMKQENISYEEATQKIGDALRGTILVDDESSIPGVVQSLNDEIGNEEGEIAYKNFFNEERDNGYIGVHAKILFPFEERNGARRKIRAEVQIHFRSILTDCLDSRKERMHLLYDKSRVGDLQDSFLAKIVSVFSYFTGLMNRGDQCRTIASAMEECSEFPQGIDLCQDVNPEVCEGNLGIPRKQMPQLNTTTKMHFLEKKRADGIDIENRIIPADQLVPVQNQLNRGKVYELLDLFIQGELDPCEMEVLTSFANENGIRYVIDGHHRYTACRILGGNQKVIAVYESVEQLLGELQQFPGVTTASLEMPTKKH